MDRAILMVVGLVPNKLGAYERFMAAFAERCHKKGIRVDFLLAGEPLPEIKASLANSGSTIHVLDGWFDRIGRDRAHRFVSYYLDLLREHNYQLVSFSFCTIREVFSALLRTHMTSARSMRPHTVWHQHSEQQRPHSILQRRLSRLKLLSLLMNNVCPVFEGAVEIMRERGISEEKITVITNGVESVSLSPAQIADKRKDIGAGPGDFVLFSAASLIERKNIPMMLHAFSAALARVPNLLLAIAGEGELEHSLKELACQLKVNGRVRWLGQRNDVGELCVAADLCLITSRSEALPFFCLEALAANRTMIATPAGGITEVVQDRTNGVIVAIDDSEAMAREIVHLAQDANLRNAYEKAASETYLSKFTLDHMVEAYLGSYCRLIM
ncbi:MAG TPA: glycosyltransferase family 4 protein [Capsulimonadaceae bacterium]|nr:glycosyltransferase family 4 protein [Capsulimonadaceae bacterium]